MKMFIVVAVSILNIAGSIGAWQPDIDINRVRLITNEQSHHSHPHRNLHSRRSIFPNRHDNDHHSRGFSRLRSPKLVPDPKTAEATKIYQPRQDPRYYYLSDTYTKEVLANRLSNEVTAIYPGNDVVRAGDYEHQRSFARLKGRETNDVSYGDICITCPPDRTLIARPGSDRVLLQHPRLKSCHGYRVPRGVKFHPIYGPRFGSLLQKGSYTVLGQIKQKNKMLRYCSMSVDVLMQTCALPKYLIADCADENKTCNLTCRDTKDEMHGAASLTCGDDLRWSGQLPVCSAEQWCEPLPPPPHGRISCKGNTVNGWGLVEGTACRIKCARGWKSNTPIAVCRKGAWSHDFSCSRF